MNFKQALIAHLQGERVEWLRPGTCQWEGFLPSFKSMRIGDIEELNFGDDQQYRIVTRTIRVNGVEVAAPESVALKNGDWVYIPSLEAENLHICAEWFGCKRDHEYLNRGLVYLNKEDATARAKAMLLTQE